MSVLDKVVVVQNALNAVIKVITLLVKCIDYVIDNVETK